MAAASNNRRKNASASLPIPAPYSDLNMATTEKEYLARKNYQHAAPKTHLCPSNRSKAKSRTSYQTHSYNYRLIAGALRRTREQPLQSGGLDYKTIQQEKLQAYKGARN